MLPGQHSGMGLTMTQRITSSADPYWRTLSDMIVQGSISSQQQAGQLRQVFTESNADMWQGHVPAYILSGWLLHVPCHVLAWLLNNCAGPYHSSYSKYNHKLCLMNDYQRFFGL